MTLLREPIETRTRDGWTLRGEAITPEAPGACAVLGHAMMVDRRTMDRPREAGLATTLAESGIAVLSFDLRGHGESGPTASEGARFTYDDIVREDIPAIVDAGRARHPGLRVTLVGHSLAGHAGMIAAGLHPERAPDAIVGLAPNLWAPRFEPSVTKRMQKAVALLGWSIVTAPFGRFESARFEMGNTAEPWGYVRQFVRFFRTNELSSDDGEDDYLAALARADLPVLAISSEGDTLLARPAAVARFAGAMGHARVTHRVVTRDDLDPPPDHMELVTSIRSKPIWREVARFVRADLDARDE
jgi:predicted alpha/beta hydrolase